VIRRLERWGAEVVFWTSVALATAGVVLLCSALLEDAVGLIMQIGGR
jgi:hypothetical protein